MSALTILSTLGDPLTVLKSALRDTEAMANKYRQAIAILEGHGQRGTETVPARTLPDGGSLPVILPSDTMASAAVKVLKAAKGHELHIKELVARMIAAGFKNQDPKKLKANITKTLERGEEFTRTDPATYKLSSKAEQIEALMG